MGQHPLGMTSRNIEPAGERNSPLNFQSIYIAPVTRILIHTRTHRHMVDGSTAASVREWGGELAHVLPRLKTLGALVEV